MFENLDIFKMSHAMAVHAGQRQALIAQNVANADTPGYVARDLPEFKVTYEGQAPASGKFESHGMLPTSQRATRATHLNGSSMSSHISPIRQQDTASPDGNSVSIEQEMLKATDTLRQHERALAIYKSSLGILRASLGRR